MTTYLILYSLNLVFTGLLIEQSGLRRNIAFVIVDVAFFFMILNKINALGA